MRRCRETSVKRLLRVNADKNEKLHGKHRGGRGDWVSPRVGNYSKPRVLKERGDLVDERRLLILHGEVWAEISFQTTNSSIRQRGLRSARSVICPSINSGTIPNHLRELVE